MANLVSRISSTGVYATNATTGLSIFDEFTGALIVDSSLKLWLDAGQGTSYPGSGTTWTDLSGSGNNGTLTNGPTFSSTTDGGSLTFNGSTQYVATTLNSGTISDGTLSAWCYPIASPNSANYDGIIDGDLPGSYGTGIGINNGTYQAILNDQFWTTIGQAVTLNQWVMVTMTFTATTALFYLNGVQAASLTYTRGTVSPGNNYLVGKSAANARYFNGKISNAMVYNRALTASEIANNYNALAGRYGLTPLTSSMITKRVTSTGITIVNGTLDEVSIAGTATAMREYPNGNIAVSNYFDEVTGFLVTNGLIGYIDASKQESYVRSGTKIIDLVNPANPATINGSVTWVANGTNNASSYWWWPSAVSANYINGTITQNYLDMTIVFQPDNTLSTASGLSGLIGSSTDATNSDKSLRFVNVNGAGPWKTKNPDNTDGWASTATTYYINGVATTTDGASLSTGWNIFGGYRTNQATGSFAAPFNYFLGLEGYSGDARQFRGNIAAVAFYNRQLSAGEQINNYNYFAGRFGLPYIGG